MFFFCRDIDSKYLVTEIILLKTIIIYDYSGKIPVFYHQIFSSQTLFYKPQVIIFGQATLLESNFIIFPHIAIQHYVIAEVEKGIVSLLLLYLFLKNHQMKTLMIW